MNNPLASFHKPESASPAPERKKAEVVPINQASGQVIEIISLPSPVVLMKKIGHSGDYRDSKLIDYLLIGVLSLVVHSVVVDFFKNTELEKQEKIEPVKTPAKVKIEFVQPKPPPPKPVLQPPPPPPPPKVVPLKKPPKPKVKPKPAPKAEPPPPPVQQTPTVSDAKAAPVSAPPAPPAPPVEEKVTKPSSGADYLNNPQPTYPEEAQEKGWEGKVLMKVHVLASGKPDSVTVIKSSGHEVLDEEAVRTVKQWEFVPAKRGSTPIDGIVTVPIAFNLAS